MDNIVFKKISILFLVISFQAVADVTDFYEPNASNNYQGRLLSLTESYPIDEMKKLCARTRLSIKAQKASNSSVAKFMSALTQYPVE